MLREDISVGLSLDGYPGSIEEEFILPIHKDVFKGQTFPKYRRRGVRKRFLLACHGTKDPLDTVGKNSPLLAPQKAVLPILIRQNRSPVWTYFVSLSVQESLAAGSNGGAKEPAGHEPDAAGDGNGIGGGG